MAANPYADWTKIFGEFKTPAVDVNQLIAQYRRNAEVGSAVIQILTESAQAVARRQAEILRSNAEQALKASKDILNHSTPESAASKQAEYAKGFIDFNVNSLREIAEMSTKSTQEAFDVINERIAEQVKEFSEVAGSASRSSSKKKAA